MRGVGAVFDTRFYGAVGHAGPGTDVVDGGLAHRDRRGEPGAAGLLLPQATTTDGGIQIEADDDAGLVVDRYGPRLTVAGDFRVVASLQAANADLAALSLVDAVPEDQWDPAMRRIEVGLEYDQVVVSVFDGTSPAPSNQQAFDVDPPLGPVTLSLSREATDLVVEQSGTELTRVADPGIFSTGSALLGTHIAAGNTLTLATLDAQAPADHPSAVRVDRCAPARLLVAGADQTDVHTGLRWIWPENNSCDRSSRAKISAASWSPSRPTSTGCCTTSAPVSRRIALWWIPG